MLSTSDERIKQLCATQMGKMNHIFSKLFNLPVNFVSRIQAQLDRLAAAPLEDVEDGSIRLQINSVLCQGVGSES